MFFVPTIIAFDALTVPEEPSSTGTESTTESV